MSTLQPQYINLCRQQTGWQARIFKARGAAIALAALAAGLALLTVIASVSMRHGQDATDRVTATSSELHAGLQAANQQYQQNADYRKLQSRVQRLQRIIERQDVVLVRLRDTDVNPAASFSSRLTAIAQVRVTGVWLTQMNFSTAPASLKLSGVAMDAELLPRYLAELGARARLGVRQLDNLIVDRSVSDPRAAAAGAVGFSMLLQNGDELEPS